MEKPSAAHAEEETPAFGNTYEQRYLERSHLLLPSPSCHKVNSSPLAGERAERFAGAALPKPGGAVLAQEVKFSLASKLKGCETITWASSFQTRRGCLSGVHLHGRFLRRREADA